MEAHLKFSSIVLLFSFVCLNCSSDPDPVYYPDDFPPGENTGKVKNIYSYGMDEDGREQYNLTSSYEYNEQDKLVKVTNWYGNGESVNSYELYVYDDNQGTLEKKEYYAKYAEPESLLRETTYYFYSKDNLLKKELTEYVQYNDPWYALYEYSGSQLIRKKTVEEGRSETYYVDYEYDKQGKLILEKSYGADGEIFRKSINMYKNGLNVRTEVYAGADDHLLREILKSYDEQGRIIFYESNEVSPVSSQSSYKLKYEYYDE